MRNVSVILFGWGAIFNVANAVMIPSCIENHTPCGGKGFGIFCLIVILLIAFFSNKK